MTGIKKLDVANKKERHNKINKDSIVKLKLINLVKKNNKSKDISVYSIKNKINLTKLKRVSKKTKVKNKNTKKPEKFKHKNNNIKNKLEHKNNLLKNLSLSKELLPLPEESLPLPEESLPLPEESLPLPYKLLYLPENEFSTKTKHIADNKLSFPTIKNLSIKRDVEKNKDTKKYNKVDVNVLLNKLSEKTNKLSSVDKYIETFSFLDDTPKVNKISYKNFDINNLYANIDNLSKKSKLKNKKYFKKDAIIEEFNIPEVIALKDDVKNIKNHINKLFYVKEKIDSKKSLYIPNFVSTDKGIKLHPKINYKINDINKTKKNKVEKKDKLVVKNINVSLKQNSDKKQTKGNKSIEYILPKDANIYKVGNYGLVHSNNKSLTEIELNENQFSNLVYSTKINFFNFNSKEIYERYSIDEFSYVIISSQKDKSLFYNIVQPELKQDQIKVFKELKKIFFNSIDKNYYSFNTDEYILQKYIKKIFSLSVSKLPFKLNSLEKKLYFTFIQRDFSGLGSLVNILKDKNIIEVNCAGEKIPISVYHIKYGMIKTNLNFESISDLNLFVLKLTKLMGLYVNSNHPIFKGNLPNGYKVEGLYSVGNISNKGSSFVIKKYLEEPIVPISLINSGVGVIDAFSYIWAGIDSNYKIILCGEDDNFLMLNSLALFYPNKKIISVQSYDTIKLPQKDWIKRIVPHNQDLDKNSLIVQSISEKPDYLIVDKFVENMFSVPWFNINMFCVDTDISDKIFKKVKSNNQNYIFVYLKRIKINMSENIQISKIIEITNNNENKVLEIDPDNEVYHINLLSSEISPVKFNKRKKIIRWMIDSKITNYKDFNTIVNEYYINKGELLKKLKIE